MQDWLNDSTYHREAEDIRTFRSLDHSSEKLRSKLKSQNNTSGVKIQVAIHSGGIFVRRDAHNLA